MSQYLQTIETAVRHFCHHKGIDWTTLNIRMEYQTVVVGVDPDKVSDEQIKLIENHLKELQKIGRKGIANSLD